MSDRKLRLYDLLPEYVRQKDENRHTKTLLDGCDALLDRLHGSLQQYYADNFPDPPTDAGRASQTWLLPYFADLLDVRLVSPLIEGRREEIGRAVSWRQRKGTLEVVDEIAEAIGQWEVVVQEGWQRLAMTPRLSAPLLPESHYGLAQPFETDLPQQMARHPGVPAVTPDFRCASRAVADSSYSPVSQVSTVHGEDIRWRQHYPHGIPCHHQRIDAGGVFHGAAFDDASRRTPDLREPDWRVGHIHPRRVLLHVVQPDGFFQPGRPRVRWRQHWLDDGVLPDDAFLQQVQLYSELDRTLVFANRGLNASPLRMVELVGVFNLAQVPGSGVGPSDPQRFSFRGLILANRLETDSGRLAFDRCALKNVEIHSTDTATPVVEARDCLFQRLRAARGLVRLEYCTLLERCLVERLQASDCIFRCRLRKDDPNDLPPDPRCVRYSLILPDQAPADLQRHYHNSREAPVMLSESFGEPGCGVLHPASPPQVRYRAEDGTEPGAYHCMQLSLRFEAVLRKLQDYLPVGQQAVVIPDAALALLSGE
ncbi:hypothetical protein [Marinobacterium rhizophilum]|uniref:hypothetical protein n=1 Tax=Marinobacterium rhizophilum TaxID=420402 RepID=UPI0003A4BA7B|nr:hypothetical protein [Marinobacterium rhizophilum]